MGEPKVDIEVQNMDLKHAQISFEVQRWTSERCSKTKTTFENILEYFPVILVRIPKSNVNGLHGTYANVRVYFNSHPKSTGMHTRCIGSDRSEGFPARDIWFLGTLDQGSARCQELLANHRHHLILPGGGCRPPRLPLQVGLSASRIH